MKIGRLQLACPVLLAPLAGITDLPFRILVRRRGCGLAFTEMVSATGLVRGKEKTCRYLDTAEADRPLGLQLFGADPAILAEAVRIVADRGAELIDLNMGCSVKKVTRAGCGSALMREPRRVAAILSAMRKATDLPLTVKIRAGWRPGAVNALEIGRIAEACGLDAVTLHPRTADQAFGGRADWNLIGALKAALKIPVIGNGDIRTPEDADRMLAETGCDAVMVGRGVMGNPWLLGQIIDHRAGRPVSLPTLAEREQTIREHLEMAVDYYGEVVGTRDFRKHLLWYTKGLRGGAQFRQEAGRITDRASVWRAVEAFFHALAGAPG